MAVVNPKSRPGQKRKLPISWKIAAASSILLCVGTIFATLLVRGSNESSSISNNVVRSIRTTKNTNPSASSSDTIRLRSGLDMPAVGYGTCCRPTAKGPAIYKSTKFYLKQGGRLIDTAMAYKNHVEIGKAIRDSGIPRSELWITSKIQPNFVQSYEVCLAAVDGILKELGTDYLDLVLIHSPKLGKTKTIELWKGLIEAKRLKKTRAIGVSNFNRGEIEDIVKETETWPDANQIQQHPWSSKAWKDLAKWQTEQGIATIAYTSLGGSRFHRDGVTVWPESVTGLAQSHGATPAQVLLRWALQKGIAVIPGSASHEHIIENLAIPSFELTEREMEQLEGAVAPKEWFDKKRGPNKYGDLEASTPWQTGVAKRPK